MDGQVEEAVANQRFDRLLKEIHENSVKSAGKDVHTLQKVLVEDTSEQDPELLTGRLSNNILVHFKGSMNLIGTIVDVYLDESKGFYYMGSLVE